MSSSTASLVVRLINEVFAAYSSSSESSEPLGGRLSYVSNPPSESVSDI